jgi:endo-1,4-beta-xylanase
MAVVIGLIVPVSAISSPPAALGADPAVIVSIDFNDGTTGAWSQSGDPTLSYVDDGSGGKALSILRTNDWDGIQSATGVLAADTEYTMSMRAMLPTGASATTSVRFVVNHDSSQYDWVANTTVDASGWTTVTGTYTLPAGSDASTAKVYIGSDNAADNSAYTIVIDDVLVTGGAAAPGGDSGDSSLPPGTTIVETDFESGMDGWVARDSQGKPTADLTEDESHSPTHAALVSNRSGQGDGIGHDVTGLLETGTKIKITAWVKFAKSGPTAPIWLTMRRTNDGSDSFDTIAQFPDVAPDSWTEVTATYTMADAEAAFIYFETAYPDGTKSSFLVDDITIATEAGPAVQKELTNLKDTVDFPLGVAIDSRETTGASADLVTKHFDQITLENHMKPEAWYGPDKNFRIHAEAKTQMAFAQKEGLQVWGHTLVWHQQIPDWFFQRDDGTPLTSSDEDKTILRNRLHDHIFNVAQALSDRYGLFGSSTNPVAGFDVVNEAVSDSSTEEDGLRRSAWYNVLGEEYIEDAFNYAEEAFNKQYADPGAARPVKLAINDYNTDQTAKAQRLHDLVARLLDKDVPVDVVGHQFHVSLTTDVQKLDAALTLFEDLPVMQDVSELDVMTGTPVDDAKLIDQGYFYRDAFRIFRAHSESLFSVTIWGLYDGRSWHSDNYPLLFDDNLQAKPAYYGAIDGELGPRIRTANVFQADVPLDNSATTAAEWKKLPLHTFGDDNKASFQLRWEADHLSAYMAVNDTTTDASDAVTFKLGDETYAFNRDGTGDATGVVSEVDGGWAAVVHLPLSDAKKNNTVAFDVTATDGSATVGWNDTGVVGTLTFVEPISLVKINQASSAPTIDGSEDSVWEEANAVTTDIQVTGDDTATATVKTLWKDNTLYVLMHVTDADLDDTASDPWEQDSVEIYVDNVNAKNGAYRPDDTQIRINLNNVTSFGTGDLDAQAARLESATAAVSDGYVVEAAIDLLEAARPDGYIGLDFQVNDGSGGARQGIRNWADGTNAGYLSTSHWGVGLLVSTGGGDSGGLPLPLIVGGAVVLLGVLVGVIAFAFLKLRRKPQA